MTADERIEKLLNRFGQTISDLPEGDGLHHVYDPEDRHAAEKAVYKWHKMAGEYIDIIDVVQMGASYICHLCDVIDRLEIALETALTQFGDDCDKCSTYEYCAGDCRDFFRLSDELLIDPEVEIEIDDAD